MADGSSTTAEPAGFRIERRLGEDVWEATQVELSRRVALRRLPPGAAFDAGAWPHRPGVVGLYAAVQEDGATFVATRFVPGARTLGQLRGASARRRRRWLDEVAATLDGAVHGDLTADDILVDPDGRPFVTGFGRAPGGTADDDRAALARLRPPARSPRGVPVAAVVVAIAAVAAVLLLRGDHQPDGPPPVTAGASATGSTLASRPARTVDCEGNPPSGGSPACTIFQTALPRRPLRVKRRSLVRGFAVRGVSGRVRLVVVRDVQGGSVLYNNSRFVTISDPRRARSFPVDLSAPVGVRFGIEVAPGGAVGVRRGVRGAATARFVGPLNALPRRPDPRGGDGRELLLRVDVVPRPR